MHEHLTTTDKNQGALSKYANTYATTAMSQYVGENNRLLTNDLGLEWFEYVGSNIETTREFCEHLTEKRYIHKSEIKTILKGEIDGHQCEIYEKTGLPKGMIEGTTEQNFQVNCGGWNCRHQLVPVAKEAVPKNEKEALPYRNNPDYTDVKTNKQGGMKATHVGHNFDTTVGRFRIQRGDYEKITRDVLFKKGYDVKLRNEDGEVGTKQPDGYLNGKLMDIKGVEGNPLYSLSRANKQRVETAILYFHDKKMFNLDDVEQKFFTLREWLQNTYKKDIEISIKQIVCVIKKENGEFDVTEIKSPKE